MSLGIGLLGLVPAYLTQGSAPLPYQNEILDGVVVVFLFLEAIAAANGKRSRGALALTVLCGIFYLYGLLCREQVSIASVISAGYVMASGIFGLPVTTQRGFQLGNPRRVFAVFFLSLFAAHMVANIFPYASSDPMGWSLLFGLLTLALNHGPLSLYDWGVLKPGSPWLRVPPIVGGLFMLWYDTGYSSEYHASVVFNACLVIDNTVNIAWDLLKKQDPPPS